MNRHHPYGGGYENPGRRGGPPGGGPERAHRFNGDRGGPRGRGGYRGRGGGPSHQPPTYPSYNDPGPTPYDQGHMQADYNGYGGPPPPPPQDPYYQTYPPAAPYPPVAEQPGPYQDYPAYEGGFGDQQKRPMRRDDKVHDSLIEERIGRERPCRTLFIRNIKYETLSDDVRLMFEEHGDIKTFFDLIANRGMVFVTYYDIRAAERARERLQGSEISGRPIDVHYSLPRDDSKGQDRERNQALQGILIVSLRNSASGQPIDDNEVRRKFQQFGDVKSVTTGERNDERLVEFYDTRAAEESYDRLRHQGLQDGVMDIAIAWNADEQPRDPKAMKDERNLHRPEWEDRGGRRGRGRGRGRGGRGFGGPHSHDEWDKKTDADEYGRDRRPGAYDGEYNGGGPPVRGNRFEGRGRGRGGRGQTQDYGHGRPPPDYGSNMLPQPPPPPPPQQQHTPYAAPPQSVTPSYSQPAPPPPGPPVLPPPAVDDRLEQARKVQQLLAALKQPGSTGGTPQQTANTTPQPPPPGPQYYQQPPAHYPGIPQYPPQTQQPHVQSGPPSSYPGLPPNLLAALQASGQGYGQVSASRDPESELPFTIVKQNRS
ncbi:hypothetical protein BJ322DRAFT_1099219 [Thelephora terrestris]|uniref:RRM domain-containing protein n=1 Tax=Thelephora terrestris TaxID=56493 RepID=A0A9P6L8G4_9AGAM|nr:hypothetical protein BJ322DRAFT_1099219 [Thelephora terrestris]